MVRRFLIIAAVLAAAAGISGAAEIGPVTVIPGEFTSPKTFHLWLADGGQWKAHFAGDAGLYHRVNSIEWLSQGIAATGKSPAKQVLDWEIGVDPKWPRPGVYEYEGQFALEGAAGLLWYEDDGLYLLPLNSEEFTVEGSENDSVVLTAGRWQSFQRPIVVRWRDEVITPQYNLQAADMDVIKTAGLGNVSLGLKWSPQSLSLQPGASAELTLELSGPAGAGELTIRLPNELVLKETENPEQNPLRLRSTGDAWHLDIPSLAEGETLTVTLCVKALLPARDLVREIAAEWHGRAAILPVIITRGWFAREGKLQAVVLQSGEPVSGVEMILPDGHRVVTDSQGRFEARLSPGLQPIFAAHDPSNTIWVVVQEDVSTTVEIELGEGGLRTADFAGAWVAGSDGSWQAVLHGRSFHTVLQEHKLQLKLWGSSWLAELDKERAAFSPRVESHNYRDGPWHWWENNQGWQGLYSDGSWALQLNLPHQGEPDWKIRWAYNGLAGTIKRKGLEASFTLEGFGVGVRYPLSLVWVHLEPLNLRFNRWPSGWSIETKDSEQKLRLSYEQKNLVLDISSEEYSAFVGWQKSGALEWGVKGESGGCIWALRFSPETYMGEVGCSRMWPLTSSLTALGQASLQFQPEGWSCNWRAGLLCRPASGLAAYIYHDRLDGWGWQIGLSFPISAGRSALTAN